MATKVTDATSEPFDAAEAKVHLRETLVSTSNDAYITALIKVARQAAEERTGRTLLETTWRLNLDCFPRLNAAIVLEHPPAISVTSVKYVDTAGVQQTLDASAYQVAIARDPGRIVPAYGTVWPSTRWQPEAVEVIYKAGYANADKIPEGIIHWMKLAVAEMYSNRSRSGERPAVPHGFAEELLSFGNTAWSV
jgi:uncharacterized phiE125 gp8 family phage protein